MRPLRSSLTVFAAALYVLLGISASWHAPHFMRGELNIGVDAHSEHETELDGESCALCSSKNGSQHASASSLAFSAIGECGSVPRVLSVPVADKSFRSDRARAPPAFS